MRPRCWGPNTGSRCGFHLLAPARLVPALLAAVLTGCHAHPFGPRFVVDPERDPAPPPPTVQLCDARPAWQRRYWQGAVAPRDYELAITVIPLEKFAIPRGTPRPPPLRTPDQQGWESTRDEVRRAVFTGLCQLGLDAAPTVITLESALVVVNKSRALQAVWEQTAEARREALSHWRRGADLRLTLGVSSGFGVPAGPNHPGAGVQWGSPQEIPPLPGELPLSRAYGPVRGPPPDLGDYDQDVTCEIRVRVEVRTPAGEDRAVSLHILTRSLPLEPPNFLSDAAVVSTFEAALRELTTRFIEAWQEVPPSQARWVPSVWEIPNRATPPPACERNRTSATVGAGGRGPLSAQFSNRAARSVEVSVSSLTGLAGELTGTSTAAQGTADPRGC